MQHLKPTGTGQDDRVVVSPRGEIDMATVDQLRAELVRALADRVGVAPVLEIDMSQVSFMDCSGLGVLVSFKQSLQRKGGDLGLTNVPARVDRLLDCLGFDHLLEAAPGISRQSAPSSTNSAPVSE
ncbi:STAS domain-containing protein [Nonomuraea africana]|uniref:Anti-sigma factor antagonist n=1 Tax=Nonomuraea africana TaxID=46171 RepID=A0ABR9KW62_9ACTN|nr:STAS domain-containing protein [Nonomuraea africana]MBE1565976.1 anti-sigma B factor antagonist [Nonomuraea africana]